MWGLNSTLKVLFDAHLQLIEAHDIAGISFCKIVCFYCYIR